jgi:hypothetical protein
MWKRLNSCQVTQIGKGFAMKRLALLGLMVAALVVAQIGTSNASIHVVAQGFQMSFPVNSGYPGDVVTLIAHEETFDVELLDGSPRLLQVGSFTIQYSGGSGQPSEFSLPFNMDRVVTINGVDETISQSGLLNVSYYQDTLTVQASQPTPYDLDVGVVMLTALGVGPLSYGDLGPHSFNVMGTFELAIITNTAPIPEPATIVVWSLLGGLAVMIGWRRSRKAA